MRTHGECLQGTFYGDLASCFSFHTHTLVSLILPRLFSSFFLLTSYLIGPFTFFSGLHGLQCLASPVLGQNPSHLFSGAKQRKKGCLTSYNLTTPKTHVGNGSHGERMNERYSRARLRRLFSSGWTACIRPAVWWAYGGAKNLWLIPSLETIRKATSRFHPRFFPFFFILGVCVAHGHLVPEPTTYA